PGNHDEIGDFLDVGPMGIQHVRGKGNELLAPRTDLWKIAYVEHVHEGAARIVLVLLIRVAADRRTMQIEQIAVAESIVRAPVARQDACSVAARSDAHRSGRIWISRVRNFNGHDANRVSLGTYGVADTENDDSAAAHDLEADGIVGTDRP